MFCFNINNVLKFGIVRHLEYDMIALCSICISLSYCVKCINYRL